MKTTRLFAATAALAVTGPVLADTTTGSSSIFSAMPNFTARVDGNAHSTPVPCLNPGAAFTPDTSIALAPDRGGDRGTVWILTGLSYELPSSTNVSFELGFGWYGFGGGVNFYPDGGHQGLMIAARFGSFTEGAAVNASVDYVGSISPRIGWRAGVGVEYITFESGLLGDISGFFPFVQLDLGFKI